MNTFHVLGSISFKEKLKYEQGRRSHRPSVCYRQPSNKCSRVCLFGMGQHITSMKYVYCISYYIALYVSYEIFILFYLIFNFRILPSFW